MLQKNTCICFLINVEYFLRVRLIARVTFFWVMTLLHEVIGSRFSYETSGSVYPVKQLRFPEERSPGLYRATNVRTGLYIKAGINGLYLVQSLDCRFYQRIDRTATICSCTLLHSCTVLYAAIQC
jgi:hypothetical protein